MAVASAADTVEPKPTSYTLSLDVSPAVGGTVTGAGNYNEGYKVQLTALANPGYEFVNWTEGETIISDEPSFIFTMPDNDVTLVANFKEIQLEDPPSVGEVTVSGINYSTSGGRWQDRHLHITIALKDDDGKAVFGAAVSVEVYRDSELFSTSSCTTGSNGTVTFSYSNHPSGVYATKAMQVVAEGLVWDGKTPGNSYEK